MVNRLYRHIDPKLEVNLAQYLPENLMVIFFLLQDFFHDLVLGYGIYYF